MKAFHSTSGRNHLKALPRNGKMLHYFDPAEGASPANPHITSARSAAGTATGSAASDARCSPRPPASAPPLGQT